MSLSSTAGPLFRGTFCPKLLDFLDATRTALKRLVCEMHAHRLSTRGIEDAFRDLATGPGPITGQPGDPTSGVGGQSGSSARGGGSGDILATEEVGDRPVSLILWRLRRWFYGPVAPGSHAATADGAST